MKKFFSSIVILMTLLSSLTVPAFAQDEIRVYVDNTQIIFDVQPQLIGGRTMVPMRAIFESLGATVSWDETSKTVTAYNEAYLVEATIGQKTIKVNGQEKQMDISPMILDGRTLVPARFVAESFNCDVAWDGKNKIVNITTAEINYDDLEKDTGHKNDDAPYNNSNQSEKTENIYTNCYNGTAIPTYTSVTGVRLKATDKLSDGTIVYMYRYINADDIGAYWHKLNDLGWILLSPDDKKTSNVFESGFGNLNDNKVLVLNVYFDSNEIWITFK